MFDVSCFIILILHLCAASDSASGVNFSSASARVRAVRRLDGVKLFGVPLTQESEHLLQLLSQGIETFNIITLNYRYAPHNEVSVNDGPHI